MSDDWDDYIPFEGPSRRMTPDECLEMERQTRALDEDVAELLRKRRAERRAKTAR